MKIIKDFYMYFQFHEVNYLIMGSLESGTRQEMKGAAQRIIN